MTLNATLFNGAQVIMTIIKMILSTMLFSIKTFNIMTLGITTLSSTSFTIAIKILCSVYTKLSITRLDCNGGRVRWV